MTLHYEQVRKQLAASPRKWLVTGAAGFIGSNLVEELLSLNQHVVGLDNFSTGHPYNLDEIRETVGETRWSQFTFIQGDITDLADCHRACSGVDYILHQAALGSVPRSITDPIATNRANIDGFLNMLVAAKESSVKSFTYAASSSTYGDHPDLPKVEDRIGRPLSPYAVTKYVNELYAAVFHRCYGLKTRGLRYFNVFGKRQDPNGAYAAVIPKWIAAMIKGEPVYINGDGETSRDFCFIENVVQANILAAFNDEIGDDSEVFNIAVGDRTTLNDLFNLLKETLQANGVIYNSAPTYCEFRKGDVRHSQADISKANRLLRYNPQYNITAGLQKAMPWYINFFKKQPA